MHMSNLYLKEAKKSTRVYLKDADKVSYNGTDCYSFKYRVSAVEMTKKVNAVLHCNDWTKALYLYNEAAKQYSVGIE